MVFAGYSGFLHYLQLASLELATFGINVTKKRNSKFLRMYQILNKSFDIRYQRLFFKVAMFSWNSFVTLTSSKAVDGLFPHQWPAVVWYVVLWSLIFYHCGFFFGIMKQIWLPSGGNMMEWIPEGGCFSQGRRCWIFALIFAPFKFHDHCFRIAFGKWENMSVLPSDFISWNKDNKVQSLKNVLKCEQVFWHLMPKMII